LRRSGFAPVRLDSHFDQYVRMPEVGASYERQHWTGLPQDFTVSPPGQLPCLCVEHVYVAPDHVGNFIARLSENIGNDAQTSVGLAVDISDAYDAAITG
jgi:hypothetical protein